MVLRGVTVTMQSKAQHIAAQQELLIMAEGEKELNCLVHQLITSKWLLSDVFIVISIYQYQQYH